MRPNLFPAIGHTVRDEFGVLIPITGVYLSIYDAYYRGLITTGEALTYDPIGGGGGAPGPVIYSAGAVQAIDTDALLTGFTGYYNHAQVQTGGSTALGDQLGGEWYWDATSTASAGVNVIIVSGVAVGRWLRAGAAGSGTSLYSNLTTVQLALLPGLFNGHVVTTEAYRTLGYGGGNKFMWHAGLGTASDGGGYIGALAGGRWKATNIINGIQGISAQQYGCYGDGGHGSEHVQLQRWLNILAGTYSGHLTMEHGSYLTSVPLVAPAAFNSLIDGPPCGSGGIEGASIVWMLPYDTTSGATIISSTLPVLSMSGDGQTVTGIGFTVANNCKTLSGLNFCRSAGFTPTRMTLRRCNFSPGTAQLLNPSSLGDMAYVDTPDSTHGVMSYGITNDLFGTSAAGNLENMIFDCVSFSNQSKACVFMPYTMDGGNGGQCFNWGFTDCKFTCYIGGSNGLGPRPYGTGVLNHSPYCTMSFVRPVISYIERFIYNAQYGGHFSLYDVDEEGTKRLFDESSVNAGSGSGGLRTTGGRYTFSTALQASYGPTPIADVDARYILATFGSPVNMDHAVMFNTYGSQALVIEVSSEGPVNLTGCLFPNRDMINRRPTGHHTSGGSYVQGCRAPSDLAAPNSPWIKYMSLTGGENPTAVVRITAGTTVITLPKNEADLQWSVICTLHGVSSGAAVIGHYYGVVTARNTFTLYATALPGGAEWVDVRYTIEIPV